MNVASEDQPIAFRRDSKPVPSLLMSNVNEILCHRCVQFVKKEEVIHQSLFSMVQSISKTGM